MRVESGLPGNENDRGLYNTSEVYLNPHKYLLPNHSGLADGIFQGRLHSHSETTEGALIPSSRAEIHKASTIAAQNMLRLRNRLQRRLRVVIEQLIGLIKQWKIVGNEPYRGDIDDQGVNFLLCTQLTAWLMESRDSYPRGKKWMNDELEAWEIQLGNDLYEDPLDRDDDY